MNSRTAIAAALLMLCGCLSRPTPGPGPNPPQKQFAAVVMVTDENREDPLTSGQSVAMNSGEVVKYLDSHCAKASDGVTPESKRYRKGADLSMQSKVVQKLHAAVVSEMGDSQDPFIGIALTERKFVVSMIPEGFESDGKTPKLLTLLKMYGGD